jgi:thiamine biosynthesis lipoprotein
MGTTLSISLRSDEGGAIFDAIFSEIDRLEGVLSNWSPASELTLLNRRAADEPVACSSDLFDAIATALRWSEATSGAFDPTVEPLVRRLGLRGTAPMPRNSGPLSDDGTPALESLDAIGREHVLLDEKMRTVRFDASGVGIDLSGIGKGIALDAAARILRQAGIETALLDFGGQVLALGEPVPGESWRVGIADPVDRHAAVGWVAVEDDSLATSGNAERAVRGSAGPIGHLLDPARGTPAPFSGSVTVLASDATTADALSTALFVMGPEAGVPWAEERGVAAVYIAPDGRDGHLRWVTRSLRGSLRFEEEAVGHGVAPKAGSTPPVDGQGVQGSGVR